MRDWVGELYSVPLDGSAEPVKLNGALVSGGAVWEFQISPDSSQVVYVADQDRAAVRELYGVPLDGSVAPVKLNGALVSGGTVDYRFQISPDSSQVVYVADQDTDGVHELYASYETAAVAIYVDADAPGPTHDGSSWADAFTDLQDALSLALDDVEIWVAQGVYTPTRQATSDPCSATFLLRDGVALYGGFAGIETARQERDWTQYVTVLSGDLDGNDVIDTQGVLMTTDHISGSNSYHVVTGSGVDGSAVLDGFTITGGDADGDLVGRCGPACGGGMYNDGGSPTLANTTFSGNYAGQDGGGMSNYYGSPALTHITFSGNDVEGRGGGMHNFFSHPTLQDVTFKHNSTPDYGGGMHNWDSDPMLVNVIFNGNSAGSGGGIENDYSAPTLVNVTFSGNSATNDGGGIFNNPGSPTLINVTFSGNTAGRYGGGIAYGSANLSSCILWGNSAPDGDQVYSPYGSLTINYSLVGGGVYSGTGNVSADPLFVRDPDPGDGDWTTPGDNDYGDLRLQLTSPAIDAGDNTAVPSDTLDLDADGDTVEPLPFDLGGDSRFFNMPGGPDTGVGPAPIVDRGAYEAHATFIYLYLPLVMRDY
jgi:predicted outer membrane repeat protein